MEAAALGRGQAVALRSRLAASTARAAWLAVALVPLSLGIGRFWPAYVSPADGIVEQYRSIAIYPSDALVAIACAAWLVGHGASGRRVSLDGLLVAAGFVLLALAAAVSAIAARDPVLALGVAAHLALLALFVVAAVDVASGLPRRELVRALSLTVIAQGALAGWQAITQSTAPAGVLFGGWDVELSVRDPGATVAVLPVVDRWLRAYGSFAHPNILGIFLAASLAVLLAAREAPGRLRSVAIAAGIVGLALSLSRSAWLALVLASITWAFAVHGVRRGARWLVAEARARPVIALALGLFAVLALSRFASLDAIPERNSLESRAFYDQVAREVVARGGPVGAGGLVLAQQAFRTGDPIGEPVHDVFLILLAETGVMGDVAMAVVLGTLVLLAWRRRADRDGRAGPLVAFALFVPLLLLDHHLWTQPPGRVLFAWTIAVLAAPRGDSGQVARRARPR